MLQSERSDVEKFTAATCSRTVRCAARECLRSFRLTSGLERRWSGGLARRARVRAPPRGKASRRRRGLNSAVVHARFGRQQLRRRGIDVPRLGRRCQQRTLVRRRDTWVRAALPVRGDPRASESIAPQKQQERCGKQAHQDTRRCRRHITGCALTNCSNVRRLALTSKRQLTPRAQLQGQLRQDTKRLNHVLHGRHERMDVGTCQLRRTVRPAARRTLGTRIVRSGM